MTPSGALTTLYNFCSIRDCPDGYYPFWAPVQANDGNFYDTTLLGGPGGGGITFKITPMGTLTTLYSFCSQSNCADGEQPSGLFQDTNGKFYGTVFLGGLMSNNCIISCGPIFGLSAGLQPFVQTQPASGKVGAHVEILGTDLIGATSVTFNSTPAVFTIDSHSLITTTVPAGATTGIVQVADATRTIDSNVPFKVKP